MPDIRTLCIEDDPDVGEIVRLALALHGGFAVEIAATHEATLVALGSQPFVPGAILLDLHLAQESGLNILRALKADDKTAAIPVIMMTAETRDRDLEQCLALGAVGIIAKPFDPLSLGEQVLGLLATTIGNLP